MKTHADWIDIWNSKYISLIQDANVLELKPKEKAKFVNEGMLDWCEVMILDAKKDYYETGESIMPDSFYDRLEDHLNVYRSSSSVLEKVGS